MPKKTKKEKIIAAYRRKFKLLNQIPNQIYQRPNSLSTIATTKPVERVLSQKETIIRNRNHANDNIIKNYFYQDFSKSLTLIGFIIALEIILYFVSMNNYFSRWLKF